MITIKTLILTFFSTALLASPALAVGQITVEDAEGEIDIYLFQRKNYSYG